MASSALEIVVCCCLIETAASTGFSMWRVTAFIGENIIVFETRYEGLCRNCFTHANIRRQWKVYDSLLALPPDLQAARGLMSLALGESPGHTIIRDFYNPLLINAQRRELGEALYIGWASSAFLFAGGCMFCYCNVKEDKRPDRYSHSQYMSYPPQVPQPGTPTRYPSIRSAVAYL
uniref:Uncharacterized protein n=1 Tax=Hucho hucho TaxID=62062 RepID=A0A4W5JCS8_9TELE